MSKLETPLTRKFWQQTGGTLIEEFPAVGHGGKDYGYRKLDGVIILGEEHAIKHYSEADINGKDIVCIQTKKNRLGMYLLGQAYFSKILLEKLFSPKSVRTIALCERNDSILLPIAETHGVEVVIMQAD